MHLPKPRHLLQTIFSIILLLLFQTALGRPLNAPSYHMSHQHTPVVQKLIAIIDNNDHLQLQIQQTLENQPSNSFWHHKKLEDIYVFFDKWLTYTPTPKTVRHYMDIFEQFSKTSDGRAIVAREPFRGWLTAFMHARGQFMDSPESKITLDSWLSDPQINMGDYRIPPGGFNSFNEFFIRRLKSGVRPIDAPNNPQIITSPADCAMFTISNKLSAETKIQVKGDSLNIKQLLDNDPLAKLFYNGKAVLCMLAATNYHRFHAPIPATIVAEKQLAGLYYGMDGEWVDHFYQHRRGYFIFKSGQFGYVAMIPVGMFTISSIQFAVSNNTSISKGQELGNFAYGGSAIILLFEPDKIRFTIPVDKQAVPIKMGQPFGVLK